MPILFHIPAQDKLVIKPNFEIRERFERRLDRDFAKPNSDNRTDYLTRIRVGATADYGKNWKFGLQYQYAHDWIQKAPQFATDEGSDLSLAFAQHVTPSGTLTLGRQKIVLGSERLIGTGEWVNVSRSMDGIRYQSKDWDAFGFKIGVGQPKPTDVRIYGLAKTWKWGQTAAIYKHDFVNGRSLDIATLTHAMNRKFGDWTIDAEVAFQFGETRGKHQRAWAWHSSAKHPLGPKTQGFVEFNAASGGSNAETVMTFDNLYPTNHKFYGSMDLQGWKNMTEIAFGVVHQLNPKVDVSGHFHQFSLRDPADGWYGAGGSFNRGINGDFIDPTGQSGRDVGSELDLDVTFRYRKDTTIAGGIGMFNPGSFVKTLNSGNSDRQTWFYLQIGFKF